MVHSSHISWTWWVVVKVPAHAKTTNYKDDDLKGEQIPEMLHGKDTGYLARINNRRAGHQENQDKRHHGVDDPWKYQRALPKWFSVLVESVVSHLRCTTMILTGGCGRLRASTMSCCS